MVAPLIEHHVLEYPGGYTRSVGTAISRYLTGLRDGKIIGVRIGDGRVMVPPTEYDPETGAALDEYVEVGPAGTVVSWTWVREPRDGKHHLTKPFAFALVRPDGADIPMVHVVDVASADEMAVGMRVMPRWAPERVGYVTDLNAWIPAGDEADGSAGQSADAPFDVIVLSGSVAAVPQALLDQLKTGGRLVAIVGDEPVMRALLVTCVGPGQFRRVELFDTVAPRLQGFAETAAFRF